MTNELLLQLETDMQSEIILKIFQVIQGKLCKVSCQMEDRWLITIGHEITQQKFPFSFDTIFVFHVLFAIISDKRKCLKS